MHKKSFLIVIFILLLNACTKQINLSEPQKLGSSSAPVIIEEFGDLQCPNCAIIGPQIEEIVRQDPDVVQLHFYHYPLSSHPYAFIAAEAAECAADQSKFWEFANLIYQNQSNLNEDFLYKVADSLELDRENFDSCMKERTYKEKIQAHMTEGQKRKIPGTPTIFVNGERYEWINDGQFLEDLKKTKEN